VVPDELHLGEEDVEAAWAAIGPKQAGAEVVFARGAGEVTAIARRDGSFDLRLEPGSYRVFVRGDRVASAASVPEVEPPYLPPPPGARPELALRVDLARDAIGLEVPAIDVAQVRGRVLDATGQPVAGARVREHEPGMIIVAGGDAAVTDAAGRYQLRLVPGHATLAVDHPGFARAMLVDLELAPGAAVERDISLGAGCSITGRVFAADGRPLGPGAIVRKGVKETGQRARRDRFFRAGAIAADGTFRWSTTDTGEVLLAAWPESAAMSPAQRFACREGARFDGIAFRVPATPADTTGVVLRRDGSPAAGVRVVAEPRGGGMRHFAVTDGEGRFSMVGLEPRSYTIAATAGDSGNATADLSLPHRDVSLVLSGVTRVEGTAPALGEGSFLLETEESGDEILVPVHRGHFAVDGLPADFTAIRWRWGLHRGRAAVDLAASRPIDLPVLGPLRKKRVTGLLQFHGRAVRGAVVSVERRPGAVMGWNDVTASEDGHYQLDTFAGAELQVHAPGDRSMLDAPAEGVVGLFGHARVGTGPGREDRLDIDVEPFFDD
jgi:hypothetical protein